MASRERSHIDSQPEIRLRGSGRVRSSSQPASPEREPSPPPPLPVPTSLSQTHRQEHRGYDRVIRAEDAPLEVAPVNKRLSQIAAEHRESNSHSPGTSGRQSQMSTSSGTPPRVTDKSLKRYIGPWLLGRSLGKGATGRVRLCKHHRTGQMAAVKIINKRGVAIDRTDSVTRMDNILATNPFHEAGITPTPFSIEREMALLKLVVHPNIVRCYDVWENRGEIYIVQEFVDGGEIYGMLRSSGGFGEEESVRLYRQLISGLQACHQYGICHRDVKPENLLIDDDGNLKICDFGMATLHYQDRLFTSCGSPHYVAPEVASHLPYRGEPADIWSSGVVLFCMLLGRLPFGQVRGEAEIHLILDQIRNCDVDWGDDLSELAYDLLARIFVPNPAKRITAEEIWEHPFIAQYNHMASHPDPGMQRAWSCGPPAEITEAECGPVIRDPDHIDKDVLRTLCIVWHSGDPNEILSHLTSDKRSIFRVMYWSLLEFKEESMGYLHNPTIEISKSDRHHVKQPLFPPRSGTKASLLGAGSSKAASQSEFAVVEKASRRSSARTRRTPSHTSSNQSYDPFRPSRYQTALPPTSEARVTLLSSSKFSQFDRPGPLGPTSTSSVRRPNLARLAHDASSSVLPSSPPLVPGPHDFPPGHRLRHTQAPRVPSVSSVASSRLSRSSGASALRRPAGYKRRVSFNRSGRFARGSSPASRDSRSPPPPRPGNPMAHTLRQDYVSGGPPSSLGSETAFQVRGLSASPALEVPSGLHSRKEGPSATAAEHRAKRGSGMWDESARAVSAELETFCDRAFRPDLGGSELLSSSPNRDPRRRCSDSALDLRAAYERSETAAASAAGPSQQKRESRSMDADKFKNRPLPPPPSVLGHTTSHTYRELAKQRDRLVEKAQGLREGQLDEVIGHIERLMQLHSPNAAQRVTSAPTGNAASAAVPGHSLSGLFRENLEAWGPSGGRRSVTDPAHAPRAGGGGEQPRARPSTIRIVEDAEPAPLAIRKKSRAPSHDVFASELEPIKEDEGRGAGAASVEPQTPRSGRSAGRVKNWFQRHSTSSADWESDNGPTPPSKDSPFKRNNWKAQASAAAAGPAAPPPRKDSKAASDETFPMRAQAPAPAPAGGKKASKILRFFGVNKDARGPAAPKATLSVLSESSAADPFTSHPSVPSIPSYPYHAGRDRVLGIKRAPPAPLASHPSDALALPPVAGVAASPKRVSPERLGTLLRGSSTRGGGASGPVAALPAPQRTWLRRLLRIRPVRRHLALAGLKAAALNAVRDTLNAWRPHGVRDVLVDRARSTVTVCVAGHALSSFRAVEMRFELFALVRRVPQRRTSGATTNGSTSNATNVPALSGAPRAGVVVVEHFTVVRCTQVAGARSSSLSVVGALRKALIEKGLLVEDAELMGELKETLVKWDRGGR